MDATADVTALTDRDRQELVRTRLVLSLQRMLFGLALADETLALSDAVRNQLRIEQEGCRMSDQEIADKLGDKTGKPNDDFFPSLCMRGVGGSSQIITLQHVKRGNRFEIQGKTDEKTWGEIRKWMNALIGKCRSIWGSWSEINSCAVRDAKFDTGNAALFFSDESAQGLGFTVQPLDV